MINKKMLEKIEILLIALFIIFVGGSNRMLVLGFLIAILILDKLILRRHWSEYGFKKIKLKDFKIANAFFFFSFIFLFLLRILFPNFDSWYVNTANLDIQKNIFSFFLFIPLLVLVEELGNRSILQSKLSNLFGSKIIIPFVIINFSLMHLSIISNSQSLIFNVLFFLSILFLSSLVVLLFEYTKNVFLTIWFHLIYNFSSLIQLYFHINRNLLLELFVWLFLGAGFTLTFFTSIKIIRNFYFIKIKKLPMQSIVFLIIFAMLPLLIFLF